MNWSHYTLFDYRVEFEDRHGERRVIREFDSDHPVNYKMSRKHDRLTVYDGNQVHTIPLHKIRAVDFSNLKYPETQFLEEE